MEGRGTGSAGLERAEAYAVDQLQKSGLAPAGTDAYYQRIKFESRQVVEADSSASLVRNGKAVPLTLGEDAFFAALVDLAPKVEAPLVFLGYGISDPEKNYNDFAGLDLKGKVAVTISGAPGGIKAPSLDQRWRQFRDGDHAPRRAFKHQCAIGLLAAKRTCPRYQSFFPHQTGPVQPDAPR